MARDLTSAANTALTASVVQPVFLFYADYASGALRVWNGYNTISWDSQSWTGIGDFGGIDAVEESSEIRANGAVFTLNGIPSASISLALTDAYQGRTCSLWLAFLDTSTGAIIADPHKLFSGRMDIMTINDDPGGATITLTAENLLIDINRPRERRYTHEDQQIDYSGDLGLKLLAGSLGKSITWGPQATPKTAGGGSGNSTAVSGNRS